MIVSKVSSTSLFIIINLVTPFIITEYFSATRSIHPQRRLRPVTEPNSCPKVHILSPVSSNSSDGNGPAPTRVQYALKIPYTSPIRLGATPSPVQAFADLITIEEYKKKDRPKVVLTWAPHPRALPQAVPNSFADWMNEADVDFVITHPEGYELDPKFVRGAKVEYNQMKAFEGADFIYAKNWACPGVTRPADYGKILSKDMNWTVDAAHMAVTNDAFFMHCLPVRRNMIVTDEVIEAPTSLVIPEAANREISATVVLKRMLEGLE